MEYGLFPCASGWVSQEYNASTHKGIDVGWLSKDGANLPVRAWKSGTVIASGTDAAGAYYVVILHENNQWSGYWHLVANTNIAKGKVVKQGDTVGVRGNTGLSSGIHLHFLITKEGLPTTYNYNTMVGNTVNPIPLCYKYKTDDIQNAKDSNQYPLPIMPVAPKPVKRDTSKHQVEVMATSLRVRTTPSTSGEVYCIATQGLYNVLQQKDANGYVWDEIEKNRWIATNEKDGWTKDFPAESSLEKEIEALQNKVTELNGTIDTLKANNTELNSVLTSTKKSLTLVTKERDSLNEKVTTLNSKVDTLTAEKDTVSKELKTTKSELTSTKKELTSKTEEAEKLSKDLSDTTSQLSLVTEEKEVVTRELTTTKDTLLTLQSSVAAVASALKNLFGV